MSNKIESIYSAYLSELSEFEKKLQDDALVEIEEWREKVKLSLEGSYRIRFGKLAFYEEELGFNKQDIPF